MTKVLLWVLLWGASWWVLVLGLDARYQHEHQHVHLVGAHTHTQPEMVALKLAQERLALRQEALREVVKVIGRSSGTRARLPNALYKWVRSDTGKEVLIDE